MPLTANGNKTLSKMKGSYGAKKGTSVFYAKANKSPSFKRMARGTSRGKV